MVVFRHLRGVKESLRNGLWYNLYPNSSLIPGFYGLPKIHKEGIPVKNIVDGIGSPAHELARHLAYLLKPLVGITASFIKNAYDFAARLRPVTIDDDRIMVSYDGSDARSYLGNARVKRKSASVDLTGTTSNWLLWTDQSGDKLPKPYVFPGTQGIKSSKSMT